MAADSKEIGGGLPEASLDTQQSRLDVVLQTDRVFPLIIITSTSVGVEQMGKSFGLPVLHN